ncbi:MAG: PH domain-containing protein [Ktedonobacteraceae bacterium]
MSNIKQAQTDEWRPVRTHAVLRRFRRGPGKTKRFAGQQEGEKLRRIVRPHPVFFVRSVVPLLLALVFLGLVSWIESTNALPGSVFPVLYLISGLFIIASAAFGVYRIFDLWWVNVDIVTNKRLLSWHGLLIPTRDETTLDKVQQVAVDQPLLGRILSYGTVHIYLAGGKALLFKNVPDPGGIRDDIEGIRQSYQVAKPAKPLPLPPAEPILASRLGTLAQEEPVPQLPDADAKWAHRRSASKVRSPLRRFGGPLRLECDVHYDVEEHTVVYIQRAWQVLAMRLILPGLLLLGMLAGALKAGVASDLFAIAFLVILVIMGLMIINFIDDVFILSNKRIIDIDRKFIIFSEQHSIVTYDRISKIEVRSPNIIWLAMDIGNLFIETQGNNPNIHMRHIAHPFFIQDKIYQIKEFKEKVQKIKSKNERKIELNEWFSTVLSTFRGVPNLQSLDLLTAIERAEEFGMELVVIDESSDYPDVGPGHILMQTPLPGTIVNVDPHNPQGKPQIHVILSW